MPANADSEPAARGGEQGLLDAHPFPADQGVVNAVADGSGIGFSLVWLNDKDGNLWMCDADSEVHLFIHHREKRLLEGDGTELVGLQLASEIAEKVCVAYLSEGGSLVGSTSDGLDSDLGFVVFVRTARASSISATRRATPRCGPSRRSANRSPSTASRKSPRALPPDGPICHRSRNSGRGEILHPVSVLTLPVRSG